MIELAKNDLKQYFTDDRYVYHSLEHSISVFDEVTKLAKTEKISDKDLELLQVAALYHDSGFAQNPEMHEEISAKNATKFLISQGISAVSYTHLTLPTKRIV